MKPVILEAKDTRFDMIREEGSAEKRVLHIKGLARHSSLAVDRIEWKREGDAMQVLITLTLTRKGLTGNFDKLIPLTDADRRVLYGASAVQIWPAPAK